MMKLKSMRVKKADLDAPAYRRIGSLASRVLARLAVVALVGVALLFPAITYAAHPVDGVGDGQQDDVLAGVDKFAQGAKESNEITLDKNMMGLAAGMMMMNHGSAGMNLGLLGLTQKMDSVLVRNYEYAAPGQYRMEDVEEVRKRLDRGGWSHLVKTKSATETTDICARTNAEGLISEMVIIDAEPRELNFIHLKGHMSAKDLSLLSGSFGGSSGGFGSSGASGPKQRPVPPASTLAPQ